MDKCFLYMWYQQCLKIIIFFTKKIRRQQKWLWTCGPINHIKWKSIQPIGLCVCNQILKLLFQQNSTFLWCVTPRLTCLAFFYRECHYLLQFVSLYLSDIGLINKFRCQAVHSGLALRFFLLSYQIFLLWRSNHYLAHISLRTSHFQEACGTSVFQSFTYHCHIQRPT